MKVSAKVEYACIAMLELAANHSDPQPVRIKAIAETHCIPQRFLVQILLQLKSAGLVVSMRGALGGYQLARSPETISLANIINAIDPDPSARTSGALPPGSPEVQAIHGIRKDIQAEEQRMLDELTLAGLVRRTQKANEMSYQI